MECRICNNSNGNQSYEVKEMLFGFRDKFDYFECANCGCLQITEIPLDTSKYYPSNYYSYSLKLADLKKSKIKLIQTLKNIRNDYAIFNEGLFGRLLHLIIPSDWVKELISLHFPGMSPNVLLTKESRILDVGCGNGRLTYFLKELGFENVLGIDPFCKEETNYSNGARVLKKDIHEIEGIFDLIMFHHSFEHISDPLATLKSVSKLLSNNGTCLIRIPTVDSYAWRHYKTNWMALDAPRHFFLHSIKSMKILTQDSGFEIIKVIYDSTDQQFWASEQYKKDIPFMSDKSYGVNKVNSVFTEGMIANFKEEAKRLNMANNGDCVAIYLKNVRPKC